MSPNEPTCNTSAPIFGHTSVITMFLICVITILAQGFCTAIILMICKPPNFAISSRSSQSETHSIGLIRFGVSFISWILIVLCSVVQGLAINGVQECSDDRENPLWLVSWVGYWMMQGIPVMIGGFGVTSLWVGWWRQICRFQKSEQREDRADSSGREQGEDAQQEGRNHEEELELEDVQVPLRPMVRTARELGMTTSEREESSQMGGSSRATTLAAVWLPSSASADGNAGICDVEAYLMTARFKGYFTRKPRLQVRREGQWVDEYEGISG